MKVEGVEDNQILKWIQGCGKLQNIPNVTEDLNRQIDQIKRVAKGTTEL